MEMTPSRHGDVWALKIKGSLDAVTSNILEKNVVEQLDGGQKAIAVPEGRFC